MAPGGRRSLEATRSSRSAIAAFVALIGCGISGIGEQDGAVAQPPRRPTADGLGAPAVTRTAPSDGTSLAGCEADAQELFRSPRRPHQGGELRLLLVLDEHPDAPRIALVAEDGRRVELEVEEVDGPPFGFVARWPRAQAGRYVAVVESTAGRIACEPVVVETSRAASLRPVSSARNAWSRAHENLFSLFVRKLFDHPLDDRTWPDLDVLLDDREHNLLIDHFTADEELGLSLEPDCADLPFMLRAYFAWKMGLPFAVRSCSRGAPGEPPRCGEPTSNLAYVETRGRPIEDFQRFATRVVANTVHSGSGRTAPRSDATDLYPVALDRDSLRPGTVYADPYGHVMMVVRFVPAPPGGSGILLAADAQPDGTIGRPRFWRGTFLFTPDTREAGAGFKAFRPLRRLGADRIRPMTNAELATTTEFVRYSTTQYEGDLDAFYDRVEAVIDPRPIDADARLTALLDALHDSVRRRTVSVENGRRFLAEHPGIVIPMPEAGAIFQTQGPWEDYSTPSRDLRLLIAFDTVLGFPSAVVRRPERFGASPETASRVAESLRARLERELTTRTFSYRDSRGAERTLRLADLRDRLRALEVAYNPNDCVELRWGAPPSSDEARSCTQRAPESQRRRLERHRGWFATRTRPAR